MLNNDPDREECDARDDDSSASAGFKKICCTNYDIEKGNDESHFLFLLFQSKEELQLFTSIFKPLTYFSPINYVPNRP